MSDRNPNILFLIGCILWVVLACAPSASAQTQTVGLFLSDPASAGGYTLFGPIGSTETYLIDIYGRVVHTWPSSARPNLSVYLLENGDLLRTVNPGGVQRIAWDGTVLWDYAFSGTDFVHHHDVAYLPNGNVLLLVQERKTEEEALQAGRDPALLSSTGINTEYIVEVEPTGPTSGTIVWEWYIWDHLIQSYDETKNNYGVVADHPELLDINFDDYHIEWLHANSIAYNPSLDQIIISVRNVSEIWVIDHATTTAEAASHSGGARGMGGDILYRWGNPASYGAGGVPKDQKFFAQHDAHWIGTGLQGEGNMLVFSNGPGRPEGVYSTIEEIVPEVDGGGDYTLPAPGMSFGPEAAAWTYIADPPTSLYSPGISGSQRLYNGNTLICEGTFGRFLEVKPDGTIVWEYRMPLSAGVPIVQGEEQNNAAVFRCYRYGADYPGLAGRDLSPGGFIEIYPVSISNSQFSPTTPTVVDDVLVTAVITDDVQVAVAELWVDVGSGFSAQPMYDDGTNGDVLAGDDIFNAIIPSQVEGTEVAYYIVAEDDGANSASDPPNGPLTTYRYTVVCCTDRVGDANMQGDYPDEITLGDIMLMVDVLFISNDCTKFACPDEADVNQSGGPNPPQESCLDYVTLGDIMTLVDFLFITGPETAVLPDCL